MSIIDKYAHDSSLALTDAPPAPGEPTPGKDAVLQLYAPCDNTMLDLGAGKIPGIRMITEHHVHLTARNPLTTISLGAPAGDGVSNGADPFAPGLQVFTDGEKNEHVKKDVRLRYDERKIEIVKGEVSENYEVAKKETVGGYVENIYNDAKTETIAKELNVSSKTRTDKIDGDWNIAVTGHRSENIDGNTSHRKTGHFYTVTCGSVNDVTLMEKGAFVAGASLTVTAGLQCSAVLGGKIELVDRASLSVTTSMKVTRDHTVMAKAQLKVDNTTHQYKMGSTVDLNDTDLEIAKAKNKILSAGMTIIK
jgi:hypothetical protein